MTSSEGEWEPLPRGLLDEMAEAKTRWQQAPQKNLRRRWRKGSSSNSQDGAAGAHPTNVTDASCTDQQLHAGVKASAESGADGCIQQLVPTAVLAGTGEPPLASR